MSEQQKSLQAFRSRLVETMRNDEAVQSLYALASDWGISPELVKREGQALAEWQMLKCRIDELRRKGVSAEQLPPPPHVPGNAALNDILLNLYLYSSSISAAEKRIALLRGNNSIVFALWDAL